MTQDDYKLWTGEDASSYTTAQWTKLVTVAALRLASFLCLSELPKDDKGNYYDDIQCLLANFMAAVFAHEGTPASIESKHVRNFTINFKSETAANAYAQIAQQYSDIIEHYSNCDTVVVERRTHHFCHNCFGSC